MASEKTESLPTPGAPDPVGLAVEIRRRLGPSPEPSALPSVSIVVLNRDGAGLLRRLFEGLIESTDYPYMELILVDNGSSDDSIEFAQSIEAPFPVTVIANSDNASFSEGCNQGAAAASGERLLFLNNDVEPFESGWLRELVSCQMRSGAGAVSATMVCPEAEHEKSFRYGYGIQHRGLELREEEGEIRPVLRGWEDDPLDERLGEDEDCFAVAAACMLMRREAFRRVGGFSSGYDYGAEDVDLCLKLRQAGLGVLCSGRSVVIHHPVTTRRRVPFEAARARTLANRRLLQERWGEQLRRAHALRRGAGRPGEPAILRSSDVSADLASDSPTLAVAFGGLFGRMGGVDAFEFMGTLSQLGTKCLFVRDSHRLWYQGGIAGVGPSVDALAEGISELIDRAAVERVVFLGASSGGYAAILFGGLLGAHEVLAFSPQTFLDPERRAAAGDRRWPEESARMEARLDPRYADLKPLLESHAGRGVAQVIRLHYALEEERDVAHAGHLSSVQGVDLFPHRLGVAAGQAHVLPVILRSRDQLKPIVAQSLHREQPSATHEAQ